MSQASRPTSGESVAFSSASEIAAGDASSDIHFFAVKFDETLSIDTCNYGDWLGQTLSVHNGDASEQVPASLGSTASVDVASGDKVLGDELTIGIAEAKYMGRVEPPLVGSAQSRTSSGFNQTMAAIAAAATAGNPLPFGHWTEPFAMVGPAGTHTLPEIETFEAWFAEGKRVIDDAVASADNGTTGTKADAALGQLSSTESVIGLSESVSMHVETDEFIPVVDFDGNVCGFELVETTQSVDAEVVDVSLLAADTDKPTFVGSSPVIATIKEAYAPYDLAERDRSGSELIAETNPDVGDEADAMVKEGDTATEQLVWADGLFSPSGQPFCVRSFAAMREPGWSPLAKNVVQSISSKTSLSPKTLTTGVAEIGNTPAEGLDGSADCLLDELVWFVGTALQEESVTDEWLRPKKIGENVALLVVSSNGMVSQFTQELASVWPARPKNAKPISNAGAQLLARAEAAEHTQDAGLTEPDDSRELAQATATLLQWVDAAESVIDNVSNRLHVVTEVARNRGTQPDSTRR